uniref:DDE Tnp4 domain-containing protein n=1 Tax=Amphimedon queenslandica TaxID=400682 RepID=A0A1X7VR59_AMPQE
MADHDYNVGEDIAVSGGQLHIAAFTTGKAQLLQEEVEMTRKLERLRIHDERVIGHLSKKYRILQHTLPITIIKHPTNEQKPNC